MIAIDLDLATLARLMADGCTVREAAARCHCHENTVYNILRRHGVTWWPIGRAATGPQASITQQKEWTGMSESAESLAVIRQIEKYRATRALGLGKPLPPLPTAEELRALIEGGITQTELLDRYLLSAPTFVRICEAYGLPVPNRRRRGELLAVLGGDPADVPPATRGPVLPRLEPPKPSPIPRVTELPGPKPPLVRLRERLNQHAMERQAKEGRTAADLARLYYTDEETVGKLAAEYGLTLPEPKAAAPEPPPKPQSGLLAAIQAASPLSVRIDSTEQGQDAAALLQGAAALAAARGVRPIRVKLELWVEPK